jgi:predicted HTH transcriptional regulator
VEIVEEPVSVVEALVAAGEGPEIEFKRQVPIDRDGRKKVCRTLAAFANGHGGHLLFGVNDDGEIVGVSADEAIQPDKDTVTRWITDLVDPHLDFSLDIVETEGGPAVLYVEVQEGASPPYGVDPANPSYYMRRGATTFPASADDVRTIARTRPPLTPSPPFGLAKLL